MSGRNKTLALVVLAILVLVGWDIVAALNAEQGDTISELVRDLSQQAPILAFALGILAGHWFWPLR